MWLLRKNVILVSGLAALSMSLGRVLGPELPWPAAYVGMDNWCNMLGCLLGCYGVMRAGDYLNRDVDPDFRTTFVSIPLQYWGLAGVLFSIGWYVALAVMHLGAGYPGEPLERKPAGEAPRVSAAAQAVKTPAAAAESYKITAVIKSGSQPQRWLFEITDNRGLRRSVRVGDQLDQWTVAEAANERLILLDKEHARRITLAFPKEP